MSKRTTIAVGACVATALAMSFTSAGAQVIYFGAEGGWTMLDDQTSTAAGQPSLTSKFDHGFVAGARVGYEMGPWRFEGEYAYRRNDLESTNWVLPVVDAKGNRQSHAFMANLLYSFNLGWAIPLTPHLGGGIGGVNLIDQAASPAFGKFFDDSDWQFGYQAIAGLRYNFTPNVALDLEYRYFATTEATFRVAGRTDTYTTGYDTHNLMASLVYRFAPPSPPAPVAVPPAPLPPPPPPIVRGERG
jgi:OOP family OmpA-OmpF porin